MPALSISPFKGKVLEQVLSLETADTVRPEGVIYAPEETGLAQPISIETRRLVTLVTETEQALPIIDLLATQITSFGHEVDQSLSVLPFKRGDINSLWGTMDAEDLAYILETIFAKVSSTVLVHRPEHNLVTEDTRMVFEEGEEIIVFQEVKTNG